MVQVWKKFNTVKDIVA